MITSKQIVDALKPKLADDSVDFKPLEAPQDFINEPVGESDLATLRSVLVETTADEDVFRSSQEEPEEDNGDVFRNLKPGEKLPPLADQSIGLFHRNKTKPVGPQGTEIMLSNPHSPLYQAEQKQLANQKTQIKSNPLA